MKRVLPPSLRLLCTLVVAGWTAASIRAGEMFPFVLPWDDAAGGITNLSGMLEKPAGAHGFITARDGHLFAGDQRIRIFGVNVAFGGNFPRHADAEKVAARMAKFGINCVRFHHLDTATAPTGLLQSDRRTLDPASLDLLDYFVAELKRNGVYSDLNLHVGNPYAGMKSWEGASSYFKGVDNFYGPLLEQQRDYARALLSHVNPYTKTAYASEPAVAFVEINNENGLIMEWNGKALDHLPDPYAADFQRQWNEWLTAKYGSQEKLAAAWHEEAEPLGPELLGQAGVAAPWNLEQHEGAKAEISVKAADGTETIGVRVLTKGAEGWHVQFNQGKLKLEQGRTYTVAFRAKASAPRKVALNLMQAHDPWKVLATREVQLTPEWQSFSLPLSASGGDDDARLSFSNLASETGEVAFGNISLRRGRLPRSESASLGQVPFFKKAEIGDQPLAAQRDWNHFLYDTEAKYWPAMSAFIKEQLGSGSLVFGTATGFSPWPIQALLDVVDAHAYWQHPNFPHRQWDMNDWTVKNESMAGAADGGTLPKLALQRVAGKPFVVTEYNHASPNTFSSEAFLEVCATAALQDWDGVFAFAYSHRKDEWDTQRIPSFFDIDQHPAKMATLPAALALFYRADLQPGGKTAIAETTLEDAIESVRKGSSWISGRDLGFQALEIFQHPVAMRIGPQTRKVSGTAPASSRVTSDNGQLTWDTASGRMLISSPRSVGVVGKVVAGETIKLGIISVTPGPTLQGWATINVTTFDGQAIGLSAHLLITATGDAENTGMGWRNPGKTTVGTNWGRAPSLVEGIAADLTVPSAAKLRLWALDERGQRKDEVPVEWSEGATRLHLGPEQKTLWWELARD